MFVWHDRIDVNDPASQGMIMHSTNYEEAFIAIADDSVAELGIAPPEKSDNPSVASRTWRMIAENPYAYTSDDVIFAVWADRQGIPDSERADAREEFFTKGRACLRASDLGKKYGWGIHHDERGRVALYGVESDEYRDFAGSSSVKVVKAMRSSRG
jgi:hypothetical protein